MIKCIVKKQTNLTEYLIKQGLNYNKIKALFRKKDIKINNKRINCEQLLNVGDEVVLYINQNFFNIKTIYEDENIIIVDKPKKLEVVSETNAINLLNLVNEKYFAVHRIDFNTEGLVVFAKNETSKKELDNAFKSGLIDKEYITIVKNKPKRNEELFVDYLEKLDGKVKIYKEHLENTKTIKTQIKLIEYKNGFSLLKVKLLTGRTHQIRAHLSFYNLPVLGDEKYGDFKLNKNYKVHSQILKCVSLKFNFNKNSKLYYLNSNIIKTNFDNIEITFNTL